MAAKFTKGQAVKVNAVIPEGPIQAFRMDENGDVFCLLQWVDANGASQTRWFKEDELIEA